NISANDIRHSSFLDLIDARRETFGSMGANANMEILGSTIFVTGETAFGETRRNSVSASARRGPVGVFATYNEINKEIEKTLGTSYNTEGGTRFALSVTENSLGVRSFSGEMAATVGDRTEITGRAVVENGKVNPGIKGTLSLWNRRNEEMDAPVRYVDVKEVPEWFRKIYPSYAKFEKPLLGELEIKRQMDTEEAKEKWNRIEMLATRDGREVNLGLRAAKLKEQVLFRSAGAAIFPEDGKILPIDTGKYSVARRIDSLVGNPLIEKTAIGWSFKVTDKLDNKEYTEILPGDAMVIVPEDVEEFGDVLGPEFKDLKTPVIVEASIPMTKRIIEMDDKGKGSITLRGVGIFKITYDHIEAVTDGDISEGKGAVRLTKVPGNKYDVLNNPVFMMEVFNLTVTTDDGQEITINKDSKALFKLGREGEKLFRELTKDKFAFSFEEGTKYHKRDETEAKKSDYDIAWNIDKATGDRIFSIPAEGANSELPIFKDFKGNERVAVDLSRVYRKEIRDLRRGKTFINGRPVTDYILREGTLLEYQPFTEVIRQPLTSYHGYSWSGMSKQHGGEHFKEPGRGYPYFKDAND
ncbi:MAG: hypothetical protein KAR32_09995, partial [Candidatus Omnitrophica bacterium]|nr:hypothetical protein [Candidatus Omnitrophota bacterium]